MEKNEKKKSALLVILMITLISLSIAYATLTQYLYINSQAVVTGTDAGWRVEFTAATCHATGNAFITHDFTIASTNLSGLAYTLNVPGDSIVCNITVANNGYIPAKLSSFLLQDGQLTYTGTGESKIADEATVNGKIEYNIVYATGDVQAGDPPATNDTLPVGVSRNLVLTATYPSNATLPERDVTVSGFKTTFLYIQD